MKYYLRKSQNNDKTQEVNVRADGSVAVTFNSFLVGKYTQGKSTVAVFGGFVRNTKNGRQSENFVNWIRFDYYS